MSLHIMGRIFIQSNFDERSVINVLPVVVAL